MNGLLIRVRRAGETVRRATPGPLLVRCAVFMAALGTLLTAYPFEFDTSSAVLALPALAAWPAVAPRGRGATVVVIAAVVGWLSTTVAYAEGGPRRLVAVSVLAYLTHNLAALAAALPTDAVVGVEEIGSWLGRCLAVVVVAVLVSVLVLGTTGGGGTPAVASLAGLAIAVGLAGLLAWLRRP